MERKLLFSVAVILGTVSCTTSLEDDTLNDKVIVEYDVVIAQEKELNQINSYLSDMTGETTSFKTGGLESFDFSEAEVIRPSGNPMYSVVSVKPKEHSLIQKEALTFLRDEKDQIQLSLITSAVTINENVKDFRYTNVQGQTQFTVRFDNLQKRVLYLDKSGNEISSVPNDWGDRTMDCLGDVYSNHGWLSVWATIQTGFLPQTGAAY